MIETICRLSFYLSVEDDASWCRGRAPISSQFRFLSFEDPLSRSADRQNQNILSVFDRHLPPDFAWDQTANALWQKRQEMELYLLHPAKGC